MLPIRWMMSGKADNTCGKRWRAWKRRSSCLQRDAGNRLHWIKSRGCIWVLLSLNIYWLWLIMRRKYF